MHSDATKIFEAYMKSLVSKSKVIKEAKEYEPEAKYGEYNDDFDFDEPKEPNRPWDHEDADMAITRRDNEVLKFEKEIRDGLSKLYHNTRQRIETHGDADLEAYLTKEFDKLHLGYFDINELKDYEIRESFPIYWYKYSINKGETPWRAAQRALEAAWQLTNAAVKRASKETHNRHVAPGASSEYRRELNQEPYGEW